MPVPSPFPGMDPYLEDPALWPNVHQSLITYCRDHLQLQLGRAFFVTMGERVYIESGGHSAYPDVAIVEQRPPERGARGGVATATATVTADEPRVLVLAPEHREVFIEIQDPTQGHRVLTIIEVLSPANKRPGTGRNLYLRKQDEVLGSDTNLVEIDLLRSGEPTLAAPYSGPELYRVLVTRAADRTRRELYAFGIRERLPRVAIPIKQGVPDAVLDLPAILTEAYDKGAYELRVDYKREPVPPLPSDEGVWARELLAKCPQPPNQETASQVS